MPEPRTLSPMKFFDGNGPFSRDGEPIQKDFTTKVEKVSPDTQSDDDDPDAEVNATGTQSISGPDQLAKAEGETEIETEPEKDGLTDYIAKKRTGKEIEDVDVPVLNGESDESGDAPPHEDTPEQTDDDETIEL